MFERLIRETTNFHERFGFKGLQENAVKNMVQEEVDEVFEEYKYLTEHMQETHPAAYKAYPFMREIVDVMVTLIGMVIYIYSVRFKYGTEEIAEIVTGAFNLAMSEVVEKNSKKTSETHVLHNGKITSREKLNKS